MRNKILNVIVSVILVLALGSGVAALGFYLTHPRAHDKYSEFYLLGIDGQAYGYPSDVNLSKGLVNLVSYDEGKSMTPDTMARVRVGIKNLEQKPTLYSLVVRINGQPSDFIYAGNSVSRLDKIELQPGILWDNEIGFSPTGAGASQKVEFLLFKDNSDTVYDSLNLLVTVRGQ